MSQGSQVAVDVGGTFTDVVALRDGRIETVKVPTDLGDSARGVLAGLAEIGIADAGIFNHASTAGLNAILTRRLVGPRPGETWLLVTSASHMPRAVGVFRHAGWDVVPWPVNYRTGRSLAVWYDAPFPERLGQFEVALKEWIGLIAYRLMGRTDALFPAP